MPVEVAALRDTKIGKNIKDLGTSKGKVGYPESPEVVALADGICSKWEKSVTSMKAAAAGAGGAPAAKAPAPEVLWKPIGSLGSLSSLSALPSSLSAAGASATAQEGKGGAGAAVDGASAAADRLKRRKAEGA
jgi:hypothetical protein